MPKVEAIISVSTLESGRTPCMTLASRAGRCSKVAGHGSQKATPSFYRGREYTRLDPQSKTGDRGADALVKK